MILDVRNDFLLLFVWKSRAGSPFATLIVKAFCLSFLQTYVDSRVRNHQRFRKGCFANLLAFQKILSSHFSAASFLVLCVSSFLGQLVYGRVDECATTFVRANVPEHLKKRTASFQRQPRWVCALLRTSALEILIELFWFHFLSFRVYVGLVSVRSKLSDGSSLVGNDSFAALLPARILK